MSFSGNHACANYDSVNDRVILAVYRAEGGDQTGVYAFDPNTGSWSEGVLPLQTPKGRGCWNGFYSPEHNAHFFHVAGDSQENGTMWVYRYRRAVKQKK